MKAFPLFLASIMLGGCSYLPSSYVPSFDWWNDTADETVIEAQDDDFTYIDVMRDNSRFRAKEGALKGLTISEASEPMQWLQESGNPSGKHPHIRGSLLKDIREEAEIGYGNAWVNAAIAPSPVVNDSTVYAMDGRGVISAHDRTDIDAMRWSSSALKSQDNLLTGGLALSGNHLLAVTGTGTMAALNVSDGTIIWTHDFGKPVRSAIRINVNTAYIVAADSQLYAMSVSNGTIRWQHQGIGGDAGLFGTSLPAVTSEGDQLLVAYPSGEIFDLDANTGKPVWNDVLIRPRRTRATGLYSGVDANPVIDDALSFLASTSGLMVADDMRSGLRQWELPVGISHTPWIDKDIAFIVTEDRQLAAIAKYRGKAGWMVTLKRFQDADDAMPRYFGPFLINDTLVVLTSYGALHQYSPLTGDVIREEEDFIDSLAASPAFAGKAAYLVGRDATLYQVH